MQQVRFTPEQHEQRKAAYAAIKQVQTQLDELPDGEGEQREELQSQLTAKQAAYDDLIAHFEVFARLLEGMYDEEGDVCSWPETTQSAAPIS